MTHLEKDCPEGWTLEQLLAYLDDDLERSSHQSLEQHLKVCPVCAAELESLRRMEALLLSHPEVFHPDEDALYRFVSREDEVIVHRNRDKAPESRWGKHGGGDDFRGSVAVHLETCEPCRNDAELLREMTVAHGNVPDRRPIMPKSLLTELGGHRESPLLRNAIRRVVAAAANLFRLPFRTPVLALGSAVAIFIFAVISVPLWREFKDRGLAEFKTARQAMPSIEKRTHDELDGRVTVHRERDNAVASRWGRLPEKREEPPAIKLKKQEATPRQEAVAGKLAVPAAPPAELEQPPRPEPSGSGLGPTNDGPATAPDEKQKYRLPPSSAPARLRSSPRPAAPAKPGPHAGVTTSFSTPVPLVVEVTDSHGRSVPWVTFAVPPDLEDRFRLVQPEQPPTVGGAQQTVEPLETRSGDFKDAGLKGLHLVVRVQESGEAYNVDARLLEAASGREFASRSALSVRAEDVTARIQSMARELLQEY